MAGKSWLVLEASGPVTSTETAESNEYIDANAQLLPFLDTVQGLLPSTINIIKATPVGMPRASQETLDFVKLSTLFITGTNHIKVLCYPSVLVLCH